MGKQHHKRGTLGAATPLPSLVLPPPTPFWRVVALPTLAALAVVGSVWFYLHSAEKPNTRHPVHGRASGQSGGFSLLSAEKLHTPAKKLRAAWVPTTADDRLVDAFRKARNEDAKSTPNLAPDPVFDGKPVSEAEGDALQAGYFLHRARQIVAIRSGEPGQDGAWLDTPRRYTLKTRIAGTTPKVTVKVGDRVGFPTELSMLHPDIVVEVRDGKIHALRAELNRE